MNVTQRNLASYETPRSVEAYTRLTGLSDMEASLVAEFFSPPPASVLDLGCGAGRTTVGLFERGYRTLAIDLLEVLLAEARRRYPLLDFRRMDATHLTLPDASFEAALFSYNGIDCIYPVSARVQCLSEVFRVLKPGGTFLLSSHNFVGALFSGGYFYLRGYWHAAGRLAKQVTNPLAWQWYIRYDDEGQAQHLYGAPPSRTVQQLKQVGFDVLEVRGMTGERRPGRIRMHQQHVHFAARKPASAGGYGGQGPVFAEGYGGQGPASAGGYGEPRPA